MASATSIVGLVLSCCAIFAYVFQWKQSLTAQANLKTAKASYDTATKGLHETQRKNERDQLQAQHTKASELEHTYFTNYNEHLTVLQKFKSKRGKGADASLPPYYVEYKGFLVSGAREVEDITEFDKVTKAVLTLRSFWRHVVEFLQHTDQLPGNLFEPGTVKPMSGSISYDWFEMAASYRMLVEPFEIARWYARCETTGLTFHYCPPRGQVNDTDHPDWRNRGRRFCFLEDKEINFRKIAMAQGLWLNPFDGHHHTDSLECAHLERRHALAPQSEAHMSPPSILLARTPAPSHRQGQDVQRRQQDSAFQPEQARPKHATDSFSVQQPQFHNVAR